MPKKPLVKTNPFLRDPARRQALLRLAVLTSNAIAGVRMTANELQPRASSSKKKVLTKPRRACRLKRLA